jgi:hypothetical protein
MENNKIKNIDWEAIFIVNYYQEYFLYGLVGDLLIVAITLIFGCLGSYFKNRKLKSMEDNVV